MPDEAGWTPIYDVNRTRHPARNTSPRGFSLLELAIIVGVMGLLMAIAIMTFRGSQEAGRDRDTQLRLETAAALLTEAAAFNYGGAGGQQDGTFPGEDSIELAATLSDPELTFTADASTAPNQISVLRVNGSVAAVTAQSQTGTCWVKVVRLNNADGHGSFPSTGGQCATSPDVAVGITAPEWPGS